MRIGILGTGDVAQALAKGFVTLGHQVKLGSRAVHHDKAALLAKALGSKVACGSFAEASEFGEIVVLATLGTAYESVLEAAGPAHFRGKIVIDATNPVIAADGAPPTLAFGGTDSLGERVQSLLSDAHVVKAFNSVGHGQMFRPALRGGPPDMFIAGNSPEAKKKVGGLLKDFGWGVVDVGEIESSRYLEALCMVWLLTATRNNNWHQGFKMLHG